jgi:D-sedoheptulose 7-phosphate isomerase
VCHRISSARRMTRAMREGAWLTADEPTDATFAQSFISESIEVLSAIDADQVERCALALANVRESGGRLFVLGVGGSAGHASHAVNDFRKICGFEAYAPTDNVSELTARTNDEGWDSTFENWLKVSKLGSQDGVLVFSVGGGDRQRNVSVNLVRALELARERGARIFGIVGRDGGFTASVAEAFVVIPPLFDDHVTPHTEGLCAVVWHLLVSHPILAVSVTKWESVT